jgi:cell fate regulator YaaT (PSP1 superfamily)
MPDLKKVTIKMAKTQGLSLNPSKISGLCGRLMCCLAYENGYYAEAGKSMPKIGMEVVTPEGKGSVVNINMLKMQVRVRIDDKEKDVFTYHDYPVDQIKFKKPKFDKDDKDDIPDDVKELLDE